MNNQEKERISVIDIFIIEKTSKNGNDYKCIVALDENGKEHFICFVR